MHEGLRRDSIIPMTVYDVILASGQHAVSPRESVSGVALPDGVVAVYVDRQMAERRAEALNAALEQTEPVMMGAA